MDTLFLIAIKYIGMEFKPVQIIELFEKCVKYFERVAISGEFDSFGGARGAVAHNVRIFLDSWATSEVCILWEATLPQIA
jgi:hypothetical protein